MRSNVKVKAMLALGALNLVTAPLGAQELIKADGYCQYAGEALPDDLYGFESDQEAAAAVKRIVQYTGLEPNFIIRAANVPNAAAVIQGQTRLLLYNQTFMLDVKRTTDPDWGAISIMAHEVGHHLQGHTIQSGGSRPQIELEADKYSGYVLYRMGASLDQAKAAMQRFGSDAGSDTHPPKSARLAAIANGWFLAESLDPKKKPGTTPSNQPGPVNPEPAQPADSLKFVLRVVFPGDPVSYFVNGAGDIVGIPPGGSATVIGRRIPPTLPGFAWMYSTAAITYGVTPDGKVMSRTPFNVVYQVGHVEGL